MQRTRTWFMAGAATLLLWVGGCGGPSSLPAPPAGQGFQLKVEPFDVPAGQEIQSCYFYEVPGSPGADVWANRFEILQPNGSHHMNVFRVKTVKGLSGKPGEKVVNGECFVSANWADWPLVVNSQQDANTDWKLPDGVAMRFQAGELLMVQTHWVNAATQKTPEQARVAVNIWTQKDAPPHELGTLFATNQNIRVCPGDSNVSFTKTCKFPTQGVSIVAANGHFHSRGRKFEISAVDAQGGAATKFYESLAWDDPPMMRSTPAQPTLATIPQNGGIEWRCTFDFIQGGCGDGMNPDGTPNCCFTFGPKVETSEHCNAFVYYWPKVPSASDINCF